jgi:alpha-glucosidase
MNEPASFCDFPCEDPWQQAADRGLPPDPSPVRTPPRSIPGLPSKGNSQAAEMKPGVPVSEGTAQNYQRSTSEQSFVRQNINHDGDDLLFPPYHINNHVGELGQQTMHPNLQHANGLWSYDTHNIYGACELLA